MININMRCIEITVYNNVGSDHDKININMRCIEIFVLKIDLMIDH